VESGWLNAIEERFVRYVRIDTTSTESSEAVPSTPGQLDLQRLLVDELIEIGAVDVRLTDAGYVLATIPSTTEPRRTPTVALLAHVDTAEAFPGADVRPIVHRNYDGRAIAFPDDPTRVLSPDDFPALRSKTGQTLITASGTTLLGADNKSGVTILMTVADHLLRHPELLHSEIRICFTPDEEIGRGVDHLSLEELSADIAYTLDGGGLGEVTYESFSADKAVVTITGVSVHPGSAKGKLVNALELAARLIDLLPKASRTPETTDGRDGFIHLYAMAGSAAEARLHFILRDFELDRLTAHADLLRTACLALQAMEPRARVECQVVPQYRNMRYVLQDQMLPVEIALDAIRDAGIEPIIVPLRGGTDGARLTERGLPTPNLFAGQYEVHGPLEWTSVQDMAKAAEVCLRLARRWADVAREAVCGGGTGRAG